MASIAESHVEEAALAWLAELGFAVASGPEIGPDGARPERAAYGDVVLVGRLQAAIARLNPALPKEAQVTVLAKLLQAEAPSLIDENRRLHRYLVEGVPVEVRRPDSGRDQEQTGIDEAEAVRVLQERYEIVRAMFRPEMAGGFDYRPALTAETPPGQRLAIMAGAIDWILTLQQEEAARETSEEGKKRAHRRYAHAVLALSKAFALAAASDLAREIREEVGFFQAIRAALVKSIAGGGRSAGDRELAIQQIVSRAIVSTEIIDIMRAAGLESPDISILSDEFLAEVRQMEKRNLAIEALKKLINGEVRSQAQRNVTQSKAFTERLEAAIARYHANALTTAQVLEELIQIAKDIRAAQARGEETGLTDEEIAFYDALAENESARQAMGEPALRVIAHELVASIRGSVSVDWVHRDAARARIRVLVKRILRKYGYPPDLQDAAVQTVLQQAEALSAAWAA